MVHRAVIGNDCRGPVAEATTREQCNALYPGSNPGRASTLRRCAASGGTPATQPPRLSPEGGLPAVARRAKAGARRAKAGDLLSTGQFAFRKLQTVSVARCGFDDGVDQPGETRVEIVAAQAHVARRPDNAGLDQASFTQLGEVIRQVRFAAERIEVAAAQFSRGLFGLRDGANNAKPGRITQAIQHHWQFDLIAGGMRKRAAHAPTIARRAQFAM